MNIIRINWNSLSKTCCLILFALIACKFCLDYLLKPGLSSLRYDRERREFILDVILLETNQNVTENDKREEKREIVRLRAAKFPFDHIRLDHWVSSLLHVLDLGLNAIEIEITWSAHERADKRFDFTHRSNDLAEFLKLADRLGLFVIVRLDPYVECADWDLGGLPSWLLGDDFLLELSLDDEQFKLAFERYLIELLPVLAPFQLSNSGPIIAFVSSFHNNASSNSIRTFYNEKYIAFLERLFYRFSIVEIRLKSFSVCELDRLIDPIGYRSYCDPNFHVYFPIDDKTSIQSINEDSCFDDASKYWNVNITSDDFAYDEFIEKLNEDMLKFKFDLHSLWKSNKSFVIDKFFYVSDTDMSKGAHHHHSNRLYPLSNNEFGVEYKYLANGETGRSTRKYAIAASLLNNETSAVEDTKEIEINQKIISTKLTQEEKQNMAKIRLSHVMNYNGIISNMFADLEPKNNDFGLSIEQLNMNYKLDMSNKGYILYRKKVNLKPGDKITVKPHLIRDYSLFICDSSRVLFSLESTESKSTLSSQKTIIMKTNCSQIEVLVESLGRLSDLNSLNEIQSQRKGLLSPEAVVFPEETTTNWRVNFLDFTSPHVLARFSFNSAYTPLIECNTNNSLPALLYGRFVVDSKKKPSTAAGIYLLLENFSMGVVLVNGYTVGKFWSSRGPLLTLFVPSQFLFDGYNDIILFDLHGRICEPVIYVSEYHVLKDYKIFYI